MTHSLVWCNIWSPWNLLKISHRWKISKISRRWKTWNGLFINICNTSWLHCENNMYYHPHFEFWLCLMCECLFRDYSNKRWKDGLIKKVRISHLITQKPYETPWRNSSKWYYTFKIAYHVCVGTFIDLRSGRLKGIEINYELYNFLKDYKFYVTTW